MTACPDDVRIKLNVSRETLTRLQTYADLLIKWNRRINLVAPGTLDDLWHRHILDSAQLLHVAPPVPGRWADLGSGAGFPGAVIAVLSDAHRVTLVEADQRKAAFLRAVAREVGATVEVIAQRIEACEPLKANVLSARALAPLADLLRFAERHLADHGTALFPKGARAAEEVAEAQKTWSFDCESMPSVTDASATILKIGNIKRV